MLCPHIHVEAGSEVRIWRKKQPLRTDWSSKSKSLSYASLDYLLLLVAFLTPFLNRSAYSNNVSATQRQHGIVS